MDLVVKTLPVVPLKKPELSSGQPRAPEQQIQQDFQADLPEGGEEVNIGMKEYGVIGGAARLIPAISFIWKFLYIRMAPNFIGLMVLTQVFLYVAL